MRTTYFPTLAALIAIASISATGSTALAQDSNVTAQASSTVTTSTDATAAPQADSSTTTTQNSTTTAQSASAPQLAYGVSQILELQQAKVDDNTIISYIRNSGNSYGLNADQIIYLRQQGLSSAVLNAMLSQPAPGVIPSAGGVPMPSGPAPQVYYSQQQPAYNTYNNNNTVGPSVGGIDPTAAAAAAGSYYYYQPSYPYYYSYPYYGYPGYGYYPGVSLQFGWGGRFGPAWGGGWHGGGWHGGGLGGGWHGGGGWHR
jgi:hypothetical protein